MLTKGEFIKVSLAAFATCYALFAILAWGLDLFPSATVEVRFIQVDSDTVSNGLTPTYYGRKFTSLYLSPGMDENHSNTGYTPMVWVNPQCNSASDEINSQNRKIRSGTYQYVRMEFCKGSYDVASTAFQAGNMEEPFEFPSDWCVVDSQKLDVKVERGDHMVIEIRYTLQNTVTTEANGWTSCTTENDPTYCFTMPSFDITMYKS